MTKVKLRTLLKETGSESQRDLARKLGVTQNCVWGWFHRGQVSAEGAIAIEKLTKGRVAAHQLRKAPNGKHHHRSGKDRRARKKTRARRR